MLSGAIQWLGLVIAFITATGLVWAKVVKPLRAFVRKFNAWMKRVEDSIALVEMHMTPNSGSTLIDKVNAARAEATVAAEASRENSESIAKIDRKLSILLRHDSERDQPGLRYGPEGTDHEDTNTDPEGDTP